MLTVELDDWNAFGCDVDQELLLDTAQLLVDYGLRDLGYNYVVLDDCWANMERSDNGSLVANATKFPDGMRYVSDQLHSMGLMFGMYSSAGYYTCAQYREYDGTRWPSSVRLTVWKLPR